MTVRNPIDCAESNFKCAVGPAAAWFDLGESVGENTTKVVYVAYAAGSSSSKPLNGWLIDNVFKPLLEKGGKYLYWRLPEKVEFKHPSDDDPVYRIYTRIAVLDKDFNSVVLPEMAKPEGVAMRYLKDDSDELEREVETEGNE